MNGIPLYQMTIGTRTALARIPSVPLELHPTSESLSLEEGEAEVGVFLRGTLLCRFATLEENTRDLALWFNAPVEMLFRMKMEELGVRGTLYAVLSAEHGGGTPCPLGEVPLPAELHDAGASEGRVVHLGEVFRHRSEFHYQGLLIVEAKDILKALVTGQMGSLSDAALSAELENLTPAPLEPEGRLLPGYRQTET